jgi:hypothetical protein
MSHSKNPPRARRLSRLFWAAMLVPWAAGCGADGKSAVQGPIDLPAFYVSDFFTPSGHMGDGQEPGHLKMDVNEGCLPPLKAGAGGNCYRFTYGPPGEVLWAGAFWAYPANNWGAEPGRLFRPWVFEDGVIRQRYNRIRFWAAARRDTLTVAVRTQLTDEDGTTHCYELRDATFALSGAKSFEVESNPTLDKAPASEGSCPEAKVLLEVPSGEYNVSLRSGFSVRVDGEAASEARPREDSLRLSLGEAANPDVPFELEVDGQVVPFQFTRPLLNVRFFAGGIRDPRLEQIRCSVEGQSCRYADNVLTGMRDKSFYVGRALTELELPSSTVRFDVPCVNNAEGKAAQAEDVTSTVECPSGTWTTDGLVAACPLGLRGQLQRDGKIVCCDGGNPSSKDEGVTVTCGTIDAIDPETNEITSTPRPVYSGKWRHVEDIEGTLLGAFGWSTSYGEFEAQPGELSVPADQVPFTYIYLDNIIWDYARQEP